MAATGSRREAQLIMRHLFDTAHRIEAELPLPHEALGVITVC